MANYAFFQNKDCEYFPCHKCADAENFNCLFCYCPLYALGDECGGNSSIFISTGNENATQIPPSPIKHLSIRKE